jgi:glycosyltransferase involved in cell wall biosynthesis
MKILIDGQTLSSPEINRGIGVYFKNAVERILENDFSNDFYIISRGGEGHLSPWAREKLSFLADFSFARRENGNGTGTQEYSQIVNQVIAREGIDLYWSPNPLMNNVFLPERQTAGCTFAATIFDLIPAVMQRQYRQHWPREFLQDFQARLKLLERDYDLFLHISQHTESDFRAALKVDHKRHVVTYLAADESWRPYPFPKLVSDNNYILYPGGFDPRKNMDRALEAFSVLQKKYGQDERIRKIQLVLVCNADSASQSHTAKRANMLGIGNQVRLTGFVSDRDMRELYQKARCLFFPSLYEGFGLPLVEALACGLPIACSNTSSLPEVAGDFGHYFDPQDVEAMAYALYKAITDPTNFNSRMQRCRHAQRFSWQQTARATLEAFADSTNLARTQAAKTK